ncbi:MAG TPA: hypothetical protein VEK15_02045 [Vicinamibacteria bacterium]|nr:hypothetical protein [Vicinamibacteria bacterium]
MTAPFTLWMSLLPAIALQTGESPREPSPAHIHIGHVVKSINGPPGNVGLLIILEEEAQIAARHAELATSDLASLESMQTHVRHVRHAIDPSKETSGPGKGFGVTRAAKGVETHVLLATRSDGATENIQRHATHVATSARNVASWAELILVESEKVLTAETAETAAPSVQRIRELAGYLLEGTDADKDGQVSWQEGEGGIAQAKEHAELLARGEGITS